VRRRIGKNAPVRFRRKDLVVAVAAFSIVAVLSATCWYAAAHREQAFISHEGVVINRGISMPPLKRMTPITYTVTIREQNGSVTTFDVSKEVYGRAANRTWLRRDRRGNVSFSAAKQQRASP
jgi:hypothetical protein